MFIFGNKFLYNPIIKKYLNDFQISPESQKAKEIREKVQAVIVNSKTKESALFIVALAGSIVKIENYKRQNEEVIEEAVVWLCFLSQAVAAMYIFKDFRALDLNGAKEVFREELKKHLNAA